MPPGPAARPESPAHLESVRRRDHHVQHDRDRIVLADRQERLIARVDSYAAMPGELQDAYRDVDELRVVVDDQDGSRPVSRRHGFRIGPPG
jgi:hypothetical protein